MAQKNRTEVKTEVTNEISATVTVAKHTGMLNNSLVESAIFRKDVITTANGSGAQVIDFTNIDQHEFTATANVTFSFTNLNIGDRVKLVVIKSAAYTVGFTGTVAQNLGQTVGLTTISYEIYYDNSGIIVTQMNRQTSGALAIGAFSSTTSTQINAVPYCDWYINDNILHLEGYIQVEALTTSPQIQLGITLPVLPKNDPINVKGGVYLLGSANITSGYTLSSGTVLKFDLDAAPTVTEVYYVLFSCDYIIS